MAPPVGEAEVGGNSTWWLLFHAQYLISPRLEPVPIGTLIDILHFTALFRETRGLFC